MKREFAEFLITSGRVTPGALNRLGDNWSAREPIGRLALLHGILEPSTIDRILENQATTRHYFGQIAVQMGFLTSDQVGVLLAGQAVRCCVELLEDLALAGALPISSGLVAMSEFLGTAPLRAHFLNQTEHAC